MDLTKIENDFSDEDKEKLKTYVQNGCLGLATLVKDEAKINGMFSLYMAGKTYNEISQITKTKKDLVLYMAAKMRWYEQRITHLQDIQKEMVKKIKDTKVESINFIANLINFHHKYYGEEIDRYITTGDRTVITGLDMKFLTQYFKSIEVLEKLMNPSNINPKSSTTININGAKEIKQVNDNTLEINQDTDSASILKALADLKDSKKKE